MDPWLQAPRTFWVPSWLPGGLPRSWVDGLSSNQEGCLWNSAWFPEQLLWNGMFQIFMECFHANESANCDKNLFFVGMFPTSSISKVKKSKQNIIKNINVRLLYSADRSIKFHKQVTFGFEWNLLTFLTWKLLFLLVLQEFRHLWERE